MLSKVNARWLAQAVSTPNSFASIFGHDMTVIEPGFYLGGSFNADKVLPEVPNEKGELDSYFSRSPLERKEYGEGDEKFVIALTHGVCDTPQQFIDRYRSQLEADPDTWAVAFTHVERTPGESGGWRWHKWGEYIGDKEPQHEYLADEGEEFKDGVYTFMVLKVRF